MARTGVPDVVFGFSCQVSTRFADEDNQKILNHATYMSLMVEARHRYFTACGAIEAQLGPSGANSSTLLPCIQHSSFVRFAAPGKALANVYVDVATMHLGKTSLIQIYRIRNVLPEGQAQVWLHSIKSLVLYDPDKPGFEPVPMTAKCRAAISAFELRTAGRDLSVSSLPSTEPAPPISAAAGGGGVTNLRAVSIASPSASASDASPAILKSLMALRPHPGPFRFQLPIKTRWVDEDRHGVLSGSIYWTLIEEGRAAYFGKQGLNLMGAGNAFPFVLHSATMRYFSPGHGRQDGIVDVRTVEMGRSSFSQHYRVRHADTGTIWCESKQVFVMWDVSKGQKVNDMSPLFRTKLAEFEGIVLPAPKPKPAQVIMQTQRPDGLLAVGDRASMERSFSAAEVSLFGNLSEDRNPLHLDPVFAKTTSFGKQIVHGALVSSLFSALLGSHLPGVGSVYLSQQLQFKAPVFLDQPVRANVQVSAIRADKPIVTLKAWVTEVRKDTEEERVLITGEAVLLVPKSKLPPASTSSSKL
eukprot:gb/GEZN01004985.1/.p1 GENE.gb/GEZN01004985.1/~~gb/GEZN01004985.1/.p1  ORF type:complete len:528 (-),score=70.52 gb/GEZN01004985.1/:242-1825(-)